jgi:hypothetical protein
MTCSQKLPELTFGLHEPIEWRAKEYAKCMAAEDYSAAEGWLDEIGRELKVARHWLGVAKSSTAEDHPILSL